MTRNAYSRAKGLSDKASDVILVAITAAVLLVVA